MHARFTLLLMAVLLIVSGCAPSVSRIGYTPDSPSPNGSREQVIQNPLITTDSSLVADTSAELLGKMRFRDNGLSTNCSQADAIRVFSQDARAMGANLVLITKEKPPNFWSTCYRADASLYAVADTSAFANANNRMTKNSMAGTDRGGSQTAQILGYTAGFAVGLLLTTLLLGGG